jgi:hypothetical protein
MNAAARHFKGFSAVQQQFAEPAGKTEKIHYPTASAAARRTKSA